MNNDDQKVEVLLTPDEVIAVLKIPKSWLYGRIHQKKLPFPMVKVGHYCRFPESGIREYIKRSTAQASNTVIEIGGNK